MLAPWLVRHSGWQHFRFQRGPDGKTAYSRLYGKDYAHATLIFAEACEFQLRGKMAAKGEAALGCAAG